jgi:monoamine oxidase
MADLPRLGDTRVSTGRTITAADILAWAGLVHDFTPLHVDAEYMKQTPFGRPVAHGYITLNLSIGLMFPSLARWYSPTGRDESLGWTDVRFLAPVHAGDTLSCRRTVTDVDDSGTHVQLVEMINQDGVVVMSGSERLADHRPRLD